MDGANSSLALFKEEQNPPKADMLFIKINIKPNRLVSSRLRKPKYRQLGERGQ